MHNDAKSKELHITDIQCYAQCRRKWWFTSQMRLGLAPADLSPPLFTGQGAHVALEYGYKDSVEQGEMRFDTDAALVALAEWIDTRSARMREIMGAISPGDQTRIDETRALLQVMIRHYGMWAAAYDLDVGLRMVGTEYRFRVPIPGTDLVYSGRFDGLVQSKRSGKYYLLEFKTARSIKTQDFAGVMRGMQASAYLWAARQLYDQVDGIVYRALRKRVPDEPKQLKNGSWSMKANQTTSAEWAAQWIGTENLQRLLRREALQGHQFFLQRVIHRNDLQTANALAALQELGKQMSDPNTTIFAWSGYHCNWCDFRQPCGLMNLGRDPSASLDASYAPRRFWEDE